MNRLKSHGGENLNLTTTIKKLQQQIHVLGDTEYSTVQQRLSLLNQLSQFELGRFLILNRGINGYWTDYILTYPKRGKITGLSSDHSPLTALEQFILDKAPVIQATQERFTQFLRQNQRQVANDHHLACIPSGLMGELLYLDYRNIKQIQLTGIDFDTETLKQSEALAQQYHLDAYTCYQRHDAWQLPFQGSFDLISSNGLNIYEPDPQKVSELYQSFFTALKPQGKLVTSFLTPPPGAQSTGEWQLEKIDKTALATQYTIFAEILAAKWQCFMSSQQMIAILEKIGYSDVEVFPDTAHIFPTIIAYKP